MRVISFWCGGLELGTTLAGSRPSLASARLLPSFLGHVKPGRLTLRIEKPAGMPPLWAFLSCPPSPQTHILRGQRGLSLSCPWTCHSPGPLPRQDTPQPRLQAALGSSFLCQFSRRPGQVLLSSLPSPQGWGPAGVKGGESSCLPSTHLCLPGSWRPG